MKTNYLFPNWVKTPAFIFLLLFIGLGVFSDDIDHSDILKIQIGEQMKKGQMVPKYKDFTDTIIGFSVILFSLLVAFSKEKEEDEYIEKIRLHSLVWAIYINFTVLLILFWVYYGFDFLSVMIFNLFTPLWVFIVLFHIQKFKLQKSLKHEE